MSKEINTMELSLAQIEKMTKAELRSYIYMQVGEVGESKRRQESAERKLEQAEAYVEQARGMIESITEKWYHYEQ